MDTVFYAERNSTGPGSHASERDRHTKQLSASEAARFETAARAYAAVTIAQVCSAVHVCRAARNETVLDRVGARRLF